MKSALVIEQIDPERLMPGGTDTCILDMIRYMPEGSLAIAGVTASADVRLGRWTSVALAGRSVAFLPLARADRMRRNGRFRLPESLLVAFGLMRFRRKIMPTEVHVHRAETGALAGLLFRRARIIQFLHNDASGLLGPNSDSYWKHIPKLYATLERFALRRSILCILFSIRDAGRVRSMHDEVLAVETWFDDKVFFPDPAKQRDDDLKILMVGRLEAQKDPLLAIKTMAKVLEMHPQSQLEIVGVGSLEEEMVREARRLGVDGHMLFRGSLPRSAVADAMRESDVLLMTSHYEGSPRVIVEASACGLPIACTSGADPDGVVIDGRNGYVAGSRDPGAVARAVLKAYQCSPEDCVGLVAHRASTSSLSDMLTAIDRSSDKRRGLVL